MWIDAWFAAADGMTFLKNLLLEESFRRLGIFVERHPASETSLCVYLYTASAETLRSTSTVAVHLNLGCVIAYLPDKPRSLRSETLATNRRLLRIYPVP